jgi:hypothetical protein
MPPSLSRLWSPSGFALVVVLFVLPFVGVSCSDQDLGTLDGSYTAFDLATAAPPGYEVDGPISEMVAIEQVVFPDPGAQLLAILLIVLLVVGLATALLPVARTRALVGALIAAVAAVLVVVVQLVAQSSLVNSMRELLLVNMFSVPQDLSSIATEDYLSDATGTRIGFWLTLVLLLTIGASNLLVWLRTRGPRVAVRTNEPRTP